MTIAGRTVRAWATAVVLLLGVGWAGARPLDGANGWASPEPCKVLDCPRYSVIRSNDGYQVRKYEAGATYAVARMEGAGGFEASTTAGFKELFLYISGANWGARRMAMTAPVRTKVMPKEAAAAAVAEGGGLASERTSSGGPVYEVGFMAPFEEQTRAGGPPAPLAWAEPHTKLSADEPSWCAGVRVFGGFATDEVVLRESAILADDLGADDFAVRDVTSFTVLQYNSPYDTTDRTNEVLFVLPHSACETTEPASSSDYSLGH